MTHCVKSREIWDPSPTPTMGLLWVSEYCPTWPACYGTTLSPGLLPRCPASGLCGRPPGPAAAACTQGLGNPGWSHAKQPPGPPHPHEATGTQAEATWSSHQPRLHPRYACHHLVMVLCHEGHFAYHLFII